MTRTPDQPPSSATGPGPTAAPADVRPLLVALLVVLCGALGLRALVDRSESGELAALGGSMAQAAMVAQTGGLTVLTFDAGNEDLLCILDARTEELVVYRTDGQAGMQLLQRYAVPQMFTDARLRTQGGQ